MIWASLDHNNKCLHLNLNVPKCVRHHNIELASPKDVCSALKVAEVDTGLDLSQCLVNSVHFTLCWTSNIRVDQMKAMLRERKRFVIIGGSDTLINTIYLNPTSKDKRMGIAIYEKATQLIASNKKSVLKQYVEGTQGLMRIELRLFRKVRKQLRERGLWTLPYLVSNDLTTEEAFQAFTKLFQMRIDSFLKVVQKPKRKSEIEEALLELCHALPLQTSDILLKSGKMDTLEYLQSKMSSFEEQKRIMEVRQTIELACQQSLPDANNLTRMAA